MRIKARVRASRRTSVGGEGGGYTIHISFSNLDLPVIETLLDDALLIFTIAFVLRRAFANVLRYVEDIVAG